MRTFIGDVAELIACEGRAAAAACEEILTGPHAWWAQRLRKTHGLQTLGMVRELLGRMPAMVKQQPEAALQITSMAMETAEAIGVDE